MLAFKFMPKPITVDYQIPPIMYAFFTVTVLSILLALADYITAPKMRKAVCEHSFRTLMIFKLALIPFLILNFSMWAIFALGSFNPFMMFLWIFIPVGIAYTYMALLVSSSYVIVKILDFKRRGILSNRQCALHIFLQLIFVTDVFDSIYLNRLELSERSL